MKIGFIGLGVMDKNMAKNILKNEYDLMVYDLVEEVVNEFVADGARRGHSPAEIGENCDIVFTSLPNSNIVKNVITGENGVLEGAKEGTILVDLSSITPKTIQSIYKKAIEKGVEVLDAPVSGGAIGAKAGTLTIMVGGKKKALDKVMPVLKCIGKKINHVGDIGAGDTVKLVNNLLLGANMVAVSEALTLGVKAGLDPEVLFDIISKSSGCSYALTSKYPNFISKGNFEPGFMVDLQYKDLQLAIDTAKSVGVPLIVGNITQQIFETAKCEGLGRKDISSVINIYEKWAKVKVRKENE